MTFKFPFTARMLEQIGASYEQVAHRFLRRTRDPQSSRFINACRTGNVLNYARVSTCGQGAASQHDRLVEAGAIRIFTDVVSGAAGLRALRRMHPGIEIAPSPELHSHWPGDVPAVDAGRADREFRDAGIALCLEAKTPDQRPKDRPPPAPPPPEEGPDCRPS